MDIPHKDFIKIQTLANFVVSDDYKIDSKEFNTLISILFPKIKSYIESISIDRNPYVIDELTSITFENVCKYITTYSTDYKFITWTHNIAKNVVFGSSKNEAKKQLQTVDLNISYIEGDYQYDNDDISLNEPTSIVDSLFTVDEHYESDRKKVLGELYSILIGFEDSIDKDIFIHKEINKIIEKDIAEHYNLNINTVKSKSLYFKKKLESEIKSKHNHILDVINIKQKRNCHV